MSRLAARVAQRLSQIDLDAPAGDTFNVICQLDREHHQTERLCAQVERLERCIPMKELPCPRTPSA